MVASASLAPEILDLVPPLTNRLFRPRPVVPPRYSSFVEFTRHLSGCKAASSRLGDDLTVKFLQRIRLSGNVGNQAEDELFGPRLSPEAFQPPPVEFISDPSHRISLFV